MKRIVMILAALALSTSLFAQNKDWGWPEASSSTEINVDQTENGKNITINNNSFAIRPLDRDLGLVLYGSRYRKARANLGWGMAISFLGVPAAGLWTIAGINNIDWDKTAAAVMIPTGVVAVAASLWGGISLWSKGRKEMDLMLDDYAERYAPRPYASSLDFGPTRNGVGFALNF